MLNTFNSLAKLVIEVGLQASFTIQRIMHMLKRKLESTKHIEDKKIQRLDKIENKLYVKFVK